MAKSANIPNAICIEIDAPFMPNGKFSIDISGKLKPGITRREIKALANNAMNQVKIISRYCKVLKALELDNEELQA